MLSKLSVVINTQNSEADLTKCLSSVKSLADEIVVIDQSSTDKTVEIAKKFGAKIFNHESVEYVEKTRNFAIKKASCEWVLILDPDEEIPQSLSKKIKGLIKNGRGDYYRIPRKNIIFNKWIEHTLWWPDYQIRLFKKGHVSWTEIIHSVPTTQGNGVDLPQKEEYAILHHNYDFIDQYLGKMNRYTGVQSKILLESGYKFKWKDLLIKPSREFINRYFVGCGYKDGIHGLLLSLLQSFSELVVYAKVWQSGKFEEENIEVGDVLNQMKEIEKDIHYWQNDSLFNETGSFSAMIKRRLRI